MRKLWSWTAAAALLAGISCQNSTNSDFLISNEQVGKLHRKSTIADLESLFAGDSIFKDTGDTGLGNGNSRIHIYEKGGKPLLVLSPATDSIQLIENVRVLDPRFTTPEGVGLISTFKEIREHYAIRKIVTSLNNVVVFPKGKDFYFTISREQLPASLRYSTDLSIEEVHIPDGAKLKYLMVGWDQ